MLQPINQNGLVGDYNYSQTVTVQTPVNLCNPETTLWMGDLKLDWDADFIKKAFQQLSYLPCNVKMVTDRFGSKVIFKKNYLNICFLKLKKYRVLTVLLNFLIQNQHVMQCLGFVVVLSLMIQIV